MTLLSHRCTLFVRRSRCLPVALTYSRNRQGPSNPATPSSAGGQPTSFKTNVNRAKTKRWVEAPSYSYDGDDWGEVDDYDEYGGYDEQPDPSGPPRPTGLRQPGQTINQAPASGDDGARGPQQELMGDGRRAYGDTSGQPPVQQQNYGSRNASNPGQPHHSLQKARSNSFDRGDERRAFSAGAQYSMAPPSDAISPSHQERNPVTHPQTSNATNVNLASAPQGSYYAPVTYPTPSRPGPPGPPLQVHTGSTIQGQAQNSDQALSPAASYRGVSYAEHGRHPNSGSRAQSMTSNTSSLDFHGRRDFSPSALPQPLHPHTSAGAQGANEAAQFPPRKSSLSQQGPPYASIGHETHLHPEESDEDSFPLNPPLGNNAKPLPFVRPADIYKRMEEERERERQSQDSARPSLDAIMRKSTDREASPSPFNPTERSSFEGAGRPSRLQTNITNTDSTHSNPNMKTSLDQVAERKSDHSFDGTTTDSRSTVGPGVVPPDTPMTSEAEYPEQVSAPSKETLEHPILPIVSRVSGFGESFFKPVDSARDYEPQLLGPETLGPLPSSEDHLSRNDASINPLQHQPSLGFRTVVRQAFDDQIPPTPSSLADSSVVRTNSESTGGVSPIMSRGPSAAAAHPAFQDREAVSGSTRTITEALDEASLRPTSTSTIGLPKPTERKPSPTLERPRESGDLSQPSFIPGHRRNISTPSPANSPARTPALEINPPLREPQEVKMAMATPIEANRGTGQDFSRWEDARDHNRGGGTDYTTREADFASAVNESAEGQTPVAIGAVKDARASFLETRTSNHIESPTAPVASPSILRAESPSKNRVRDLAGMFESGSHSKSGSEHSSPLRGNSFGANTPGVERPAAGRLESFRPRLPGGWESFASTAPSIAPYVSNNSKERGNSVTWTADANNAATTPRDQDTNDDIDVTPTTVKRALSKSEHDFHSKSGNTLEDPFSVVAAAGTALAGALAAAVGLGNGEDAVDKDQESFAKPEAAAAAGDFGAARGRSASIQNTTIHPEASKALNRLPSTDSVSSGAPTPPPKDTPLAGNKSAADADYFAPIEPLKNRPRSQITTSDQATPPARPAMLPYMSIDIIPQDLESDRLRKEIVRSLSPATHTKQTSNVETASSSLDQPLSNNTSLRSQAHDGMVIPSEYDSYWNEANSEDGLSPRPSENPDSLGPTSPVSNPQVQALVGKFEQSALSNGNHRALPASTDEERQPEEDVPTPPAALSHRFSWEQENAELAAVPGAETLDHPRSSGTDTNAIPDETREQETALNSPQRTIEFQETQSPTSRDVLNAEFIDQAASELPAAEQGASTGLSGHTMNLWGPAAVSDSGHDTSSQHGGSYNEIAHARDHGSNSEILDRQLVEQTPTSSEAHLEAIHMQTSHDPYSNDPYANDLYADNVHSLPPHHGFEGQSGDVPPFVNQESSSQHPFEGPSSDPQALNFQEASPQHEPEDQYAEAQATKNLPSTSSQHSPHDLVNIPDNQNEQPLAQRGNLPPLQPPAAGTQPRISGFREILALQSAADRIRAYNATREQFANMNTGLAHWITVTANEMPEHVGLLSPAGRPAAAPASLSGTPTRGKLSGLRPAGAQPAQQPYYQQYLNASSQPTTPGSATASPNYSEPYERPSLPTSGGSGRVQAKGKDLLKNAGVFGGKANVAAKGLFSKRKSRFRSSGGGDKVEK